MRQFLDITAALADENRVRALLALRGGELCLCQITELLGLAPSTVSKHLSLLKQAGLVDCRKEGRWIFYRTANGEQAAPEALAALTWVSDSLERDPRVAQDKRQLKVILQEDPEEICKRQGQRRGCCSSAPATPAAARWPKASPATSKAK